jgi:hypothetical protein
MKNTKWTRRGLVRGIGAVIAIGVMVFVGLAPVGATFDHCEANGGVPIFFRSIPDNCEPAEAPQELRSSRYSSTAGEIMWQRSSGAIGYEIVRDGVSLGGHDVLSWFMTDLEETRSYTFQVRAIYPDDTRSEFSQVSIPSS